MKAFDVINESIISKVAYKKTKKAVPATVYEARLTKLIEIGFVWNAWEADWLHSYQELVAFEKHSNSTLLPRELDTWGRAQ